MDSQSCHKTCSCQSNILLTIIYFRFSGNSVKLVMTLFPSKSPTLPEIPKDHCDYDLHGCPWPSISLCSQWNSLTLPKERKPALTLCQTCRKAPQMTSWTSAVCLTRNPGVSSVARHFMVHNLYMLTRDRKKLGEEEGQRKLPVKIRILVSCTVN